MSDKSKSNKWGDMFNELYRTLLFFSARTIAILLGLFIGYYIITTRGMEKLDNMCLTNTSNCMTVEVYRYKNTFLARDDVSQIWFWYNGINLYVYGQANGVCQSPNGQPIDPVNVFQMSMVKDDKGNKVIHFSALPNECIDSVTTIINYYKNELNLPLEPFIIKRKNPSEVINVYTIIQAMYDNNIFKFKNDV